MKTKITFLVVFFMMVTCFSQPVIEWEKSFGGSGVEGINSFQKSSDGGYIIAGYSNSNDGDVTGNHGGYDFWVLKLTSVGALEWQKSLGGSLDDIANSIFQTSEGGYIVSGITESNDGDVTENKGNNDVWIVKLSSNGTIEWQKSYGGASSESGESIQQTSDGGHIVAGWSFSQNGDVTGNHGSVDHWVIKLTDSGNIEWEKTLGGLGADWAWAVQQTSDGGYIVAGDSNNKSGDVTANFGSVDYWVVKLYSSGLIDWQKSFGGGLGESPKSIQQTTDGGYIITGFSASNDGNVTGNHGESDYWVVKITATGSLEWQKSLGGTDAELYAYALQVSNDDYIVAGTTFSNDGDVTVNNGASDIWIVQLTPFLGVDDTDLGSTILLYPNPNTGQFYLNFSSLKDVSSISIIDVLGRSVYSNINISPETVEINQNLAAGMYVVTVKSGASATYLKMIVE